MNEIIDLKLSFGSVATIFGSEEGKLMAGDMIFFSKRLMLSEIYNQLTQEQKDNLSVLFPLVIEKIKTSGMCI